jgi:hypothetical protein
MQAQYALGGAYYNGKGVARNPEQGAKRLQKATEQGHIAAQCDLGVMYQKGIGVEQDYKATLKWFRVAAEQGDALAQHNLGSLNAKGFKVIADRSDAESTVGAAPTLPDLTQSKYVLSTEAA